MKLKNAILPIFGITLLATSCEKYDEGPLISLKSKEERLANTWVINSAMENDQDATNDYDHYELFMTADGDAELDANYIFLDQEFDIETNGTWDLMNNDEQIVFDYEDDDFDKTYQILKLTEDELKLREVGEDLELTLNTK
ncbi:MAG: lipocalin family protein [Flavobacteriales bacterium]|nr:lipocalin family protein [Flavobacteriales bacterium]